ncbi:MAG: hypothetical protein HY737_04880 [Candidatus Omnitrophica bacterium]|nr:hypothetical protein [Candidatus Omnitrophota bacterium]
MPPILLQPDPYAPGAEMTVASPPMALIGEDIVCFAGEDWWYHNPHSNFHLMKAFAAQNRVLFVNSIGVAAPSPRQGRVFWKKLFRKLGSLTRYLRRSPEGILVLTPIALPMLGRWRARITWVNTVLLLIQLRVLLWALRMRRPILWVTLPTVKDVALALNRRAKCLVYYCVDNISQYAGADAYEVFLQETALQRAADLAFFVNEDLVEERRSYNAKTLYLGHGVDFEHFAAAQHPVTPEPEDLRDIPRPIVGYFGLVRDLNLFLIRYLAERNPEISLVFLGEVAMDVSSLNALPNVYFLGRRPYETLPQYGKAFTCCGLYYQTGDGFNDYRNPKKLLEYLATGKPIVSVALRHLAFLQGLVAVAHSPREFNQQLQQALIDAPNAAARLARMAYARQQTWDHIAARAASLITSVAR